MTIVIFPKMSLSYSIPELANRWPPFPYGFKVFTVSTMHFTKELGLLIPHLLLPKAHNCSICGMVWILESANSSILSYDLMFKPQLIRLSQSRHLNQWPFQKIFNITVQEYYEDFSSRAFGALVALITLNVLGGKNNGFEIRAIIFDSRLNTFNEDLSLLIITIRILSDCETGWLNLVVRK